MPEPLAHSPRPPVGPQTYRCHVQGTMALAECNAAAAARFFRGDGEAFFQTVRAAAIYHDLGKLDERNQAVLARESREPLPGRHEDAGAAHLFALHRAEAAVLVYGHHAGLFSQAAERGKPASPFRFEAEVETTARHLSRYVETHRKHGCEDLDSLSPPAPPLHGSGFERRVALSCLVDADHSDTAQHYRAEVPVDPVAPRWQERLAALDRYVAGLPRRSPARDALREDVYAACRVAEVEPARRSCDAPVGSGKTTAVMAHLLRVAAERGLRHIFVVLPYVNVIRQSVDVYRQALVLPGEDPEEVVAEHHHQADFQGQDARQLATLWRAPIIVTTAVQFFETLAAFRPARLRKLHELVGSAAFIDETHAAIPSPLWPQAWKWLDEWCADWGGHVVFASGSLPRFWQLPDVMDPLPVAEIPDLLPDALRERLQATESRRVVVRRIRTPLTCDELIRRVTSAPGPRLLILNTVQSAAVVGDRMHREGHDVLHLSTALAPVHRDRILDQITARLRDCWSPDWTLVATSCVEAGLDLSFRTGLRERSSMASLLQVMGRVGRHGEYDESVVCDFVLDDPLLNHNPSLDLSHRVLAELLDSGRVDAMPAGQLASEAMRLELTQGGKAHARRLLEAEAGMEYPTVAALCRVIEDDSRVVVVDSALAERVMRGEPVDRRELLRHSVQIWAKRVDDLRLRLIAGEGRHRSLALYAWGAAYDPDFLGYMAGVLPSLRPDPAGPPVA